MKINFIKYNRKKLNLSQNELGKKIGLTRRQIIYLEKGEKKTQRQTKLAIMYLLIKRKKTLL